MRYFHCILLVYLLPFCAYAQYGRPEIVGQKPLHTNEEQSITVNLPDLFVIDKDDVYPWGFTLTLYEGSDYTINDHTVTPNLNFNGTLTVPVTVYDGQYESKKFNLKITVNPVNDIPVITGQSELQTIEGTAITLLLSHLSVDDPDNSYPKDFILTVGAGNNYSVSGPTVIPHAGFIGSLIIPVTVNDGAASSSPFNVIIPVVPRNQPPVITGQVPLSTSVNTSITLELSHLQVSDPDNKYPDDFTLTIYEGNNYTFSGKVVTPANQFTGTLWVKITVNDGTTNSEPYNLKIEVTGELAITGHVPLEINEDETLTLQLTHLTVYDPNHQYPNGFSLLVSNGTNYTVNGNTIKPASNYHGNLSVGVSVRNSSATSKPYPVTITVKAVNDPPAITSFPLGVLRYTIGNGPVHLFKEIEIADSDDEKLMSSEVAIRAETFRSGKEEIIVDKSPNIHTVFDASKGVLTLVGSATLAEYQQALRSVQYNYTDLENPAPETKTITVKLYDGKNLSEVKERHVAMKEPEELDIPTCFTPNNDASNDTWKIKPRIASDGLNNAVVRVFNKRGMLIFESKGFEKEWDGRYKGEFVPADTYFYLIILNVNASSKNFKGVVNIVR